MTNNPYTHPVLKTIDYICNKKQAFLLLKLMTYPLIFTHPKRPLPIQMADGQAIPFWQFKY